ncbi:MAG: hypothetical protein ACO1OB_18865 [Archangium sp.]
MSPNQPIVAPEKFRSVTAILVMIAVVVFLCAVGMCLVSIPNFLKFGARSKAAECKQVLKQLYVAQKARRGGYATDFETLNFTPEPGMNRYAYIVSPGQMVEPTQERAQKRGLIEAMPAPVRQSLGLHDGEITMACVGDLDGDPGVDVWTISTKVRSYGGETIPAGQPHHDVDDLDD